ncbi:MAG: hypothetical protein NXI30_26840 [bacterium]|nr:hypothetical protein [bacterium]
MLHASRSSSARSLARLVFSLVLFLAAPAGAVVYDVDLVVTGAGNSGTVVGTIETDGTIGTGILPSNIVAFELALSTNGSTVVAQFPGTGVIGGVSVSLAATADELIWPRGGNSAGEFSFCDGSCFVGNPRFRLTGGGLMLIEIPGELAVSQGFPIGTDVTIGTAAPSVPLGPAVPIAAALGLGLLGARLARGRRP